MTDAYTLKGNKLHIFPLSDLHLGSKHCNTDFFYTWCELFDDLEKNKIIYCLGDLIDMTSNNLDPSSASSSVDEAITDLVDMLESYKQYIRYYVAGNHEVRVKRFFDFDVSRLIAEEFDCNYSYNDFFDKINIGDKLFTVYGASW